MKMLAKEEVEEVSKLYILIVIACISILKGEECSVMGW